jgi:NAD(P)H-hydrate epimerase
MSARNHEIDGHRESPAGLYRVEVVRALEESTIASGVEGYELMSRAAAAALQALRARWPVARDLLVLCGGGNNGGDGYVLAKLAREAGLTPRVLAAVPIDRLTGDAARAATQCMKGGTPVENLRAGRFDVERLAGADVIVDALLGIGLQSEVRADLAEIIRATNKLNRPVLALDVPSGLCADTGAVRGVAVHAAVTVTFIARKAGLWLGAGPDHAGEVVLADLGIDATTVSPTLNLLSPSNLTTRLPSRPRDARKGHFGHVLVFGGGEGMPGAARLAGEAALRAGAGRVTAWVAPESATAVAAGCPELMVRGLGTGAASADLLQSADILAIGPGLGRSEWSRVSFANALSAARARELPVVLDADALNLLAEQPGLELPTRTILTPHPGEAARLLGRSTSDVQRDRVRSLKEMQDRYTATIVLKGAGSLVSDHIPFMCDRGTPAMAAPGMGDVLTGVIAALLGQGFSTVEAARLGVLWHALAGEAAARGVDRGVLASEVSWHLPRVLTS